MSENLLEFALPDRSTVSKGFFATTPEEIKSWIEQLPLADAGKSSRQVFEAIFQLNRLDVPQLARMEIAELFLQPIAYLSENLRKLYFDQAFPLSEKNRKIALLDRELHAELALSYKITIDQLIRGKKARADRKRVVIAIHRAVRCLSRVLYQSAIVYEPYPQGTWNEIHRLFEYAEQSRIHELPVAEGKTERDTSTISDLYRRILLLSISSPYRLRQREIEYIELQLPIWDRLTTLERVESDAGSRGLFIIRLDSDLPPAHRSLQREAIKMRCRQLNTRRLVQRLREDFGHLPLRGKNPGMEDLMKAQLSGQMMQAFSTMRKRKFVRTKLNGELRNVAGLPALHAILSARKPERGVEKESRPLAQEQEFDWFEPPRNRPLINTLLYTSEGSTAYTLIHMDAEEQTSNSPAHGVAGGRDDHNHTPFWTIDSEEQLAEPFSCTTINQSANGYCIRWQGPNAPRLRVGEILGIQSASDTGLFNIGVSRWLKHIPGEGLNVGMELISPSAIPVSARLRDATRHAEPLRECLLLRGLNTSDRPATLIVPTLVFQAGDQLSIEDSSRERQVRLTRLLETTGSFARFQFAYLDDGETG